ncbi:hypothetical protein KP786_00295 [Streptococcus equi subsp. zooepidemicus]|nr:hypothetical protein [Streptococcus equi]MCD3406347.1 hypothetical protein [Streptococcus equi subsp. zooepidemicus]
MYSAQQALGIPETAAAGVSTILSLLRLLLEQARLMPAFSFFLWYMERKY